MKGSFQIRIQNAAIRYEFAVRRNITIIKGDSATGKTTLVEMISEYYENGRSSGIELFCDRVCSVVSGRDWHILLQSMTERIIFIDDGNEFIRSTEFAKAIQKTDNYYVIVTREGLPNLPYSVDEIYGIRQSGKYANLKQTYNELYHIYGKRNRQCHFSPLKLVVEDSNSGYEFFKGLSIDKSREVVSANGKSNVFSEVLKNADSNKILVIADGAAFGSEMDRMMKLIDGNDNILLYLPESFEWMILNAKILGDNEVARVLEDPSMYIESSEYFSWERFFTALLMEKTENSYLKYTKKKLNPVYLQKNIQQKIIAQIKDVDL